MATYGEDTTVSIMFPRSLPNLTKFRLSQAAETWTCTAKQNDPNWIVDSLENGSMSSLSLIMKVMSASYEANEAPLSFNNNLPLANR